MRPLLHRFCAKHNFINLDFGHIQAPLCKKIGNDLFLFFYIAPPSEFLLNFIHFGGQRPSCERSLDFEAFISVDTLQFHFWGFELRWYISYPFGPMSRSKVVQPIYWDQGNTKLNLAYRTILYQYHNTITWIWLHEFLHFLFWFFSLQVCLMTCWRSVPQWWEGIPVGHHYSS